ncbi:MAG TPA: hypothetical protein VF988_00270 [Verrucomicrobiae bacterium]
MNEWNIQSRAHACQACTQPFVDKQRYHTLLYDEHAEVLHRMDICDACWQSQFSEGARERKGFVSHWQGVFEVPPVVVDPIQKETAETLLRKIIELNNPRYVPAAYILAVMLERKRLLKVKEQIKRDGRRLFVYEHSKSGDVFTVLDPDLHLNQLAEVQHDVAQLLEHGLHPSAASAESPNPAVTPEAPAPEGMPSAEDTPPVEPAEENDHAQQPNS